MIEPDKKNLEQGAASLDQNTEHDKPVKTAEEKKAEHEAFLARLEQDGKKLLTMKSAPSDQLRAKIIETLTVLHGLHEDVIEKKNLALEKSNVIKGKVNELMQAGTIKVDQEEYNRSEESIAQYTASLDMLTQEIEREASQLLYFLSDEQTSNVIVEKSDTDDVVELIEKKIKFVKKYIRDMQRDLNVSFSRYCFGFDNQLKKILYIQSYIKQHKQ